MWKNVVERNYGKGKGTHDSYCGFAKHVRGLFCSYKFLKVLREFARNRDMGNKLAFACMNGLIKFLQEHETE